MAHRRDESDEAYPNTCTWILKNQCYEKWIKLNHGILWVKGVPGSGKTTLMRFLRQRVEGIPTIRQDLTLDFFFHRRGVILQYSIIGMFRSLLYQLYTVAPPSTREKGREKFREKMIAQKPGLEFDWQLKELQNLFSEAVIKVSKLRPSTIFIDALDEAGEETAEGLVSYFDRLNSQLTQSNSRIKLCISCRHFPILETTSGYKINVEENNQEDISAYIRYELKLRLPRDIVELLGIPQIEAELINRASGVFLWAILVVPMTIRWINHGKSRKEISQMLSQVPDRLADVYDYILEEAVKTDGPSQTLHLLQWVYFAKRPLSVEELRFAIAVDE